MICPEEEAKGKWCPMYRVSDAGEYFTISNRGDYAQHSVNLSPPNCIGQDCMAWVWITPDHAKGRCGLIGRG